MIHSVNTNKSIFWIFAGLLVVFISISILTNEYFWVAIPFGILLSYLGWQNISIVFYFLLATLPFSMEYNFSSGWGTDIPDEFLMLLMSGLIFLYIIYKPEEIKKQIRHPLLLILFFSVLWTLNTVIFSVNPVVSIKYLLAKSWYIGAFVLAPLVVFKSKNAIKTAAIILAASMFIVTVVILARHGQYNFRFAEINNAVQPFFRNHVNYSALLVSIIPLYFAFYKLTGLKRVKIIISITIVILLIALFFSYSRGAWLALFSGLIAFILIRKKLLLISFFTFIIISFGFLLWMKSNNRYLQYSPDFQTTIFHQDFREHLIATYRLKDVSTEERFYRWIAGIRMIKDNWLTGYGPNTFSDNYKPYAIPAFKTWVSDNKDKSTVHNYFLLITVEQGIPGLIFFLLLTGGLLYYAQKIYHSTEDIFYKTVAATIASVFLILITVNLLSDLIETDKIGSIFFLSLSTLVVTDFFSKKKSVLATDV